MVTLATITLFSISAFRQVYQQYIADGLAIYARLTAQSVLPYFRAEQYEELQQYCQLLTKEADARVTLLLPDGMVVADSQCEPGAMDNHGRREEVQSALENGSGQSIRLSETLGEYLFYYAVPIQENGDLLGIARVALPFDQIQHVMGRIRTRILIGAGGIALFTLLVSMFVSWAVNRPVRSMIQGVQRFARGNFTYPLEISHLAEVAVLSESLNEMAAQLDERLRLVTKERNQQEAVLSSMVEGVLAVDNQGRIMTFNQAATRLTGINFEQAPNQTLGAVAPNTPLAQFVAQILNSAKPKESEFGNLSQGGRILQVHGSILRDAHGKGIGAVVVLNDVTRLSRLEQVRRDFVANVSHELRTPITSIKGFVETLLDGALNNPEDARRFLEIVAKQSDRLNAILGDLLTLSRIEEGEEKANIETEVMAIRETLDAALQLCLKKASAKNIQVQLKCEENVQARINPSLLEQAISNLIDNAIKYSPAGSNVMIYAEHQHNEVMICVEDHGCGISAEHLPRLFERFYRVDKARSRALGGTGLGLSIVNHIITAHGGRVTVESVLGTGSTFCVYLPAA